MMQFLLCIMHLAMKFMATDEHNLMYALQALNFLHDI